MKSTRNISCVGETKCWREITIIKGVSVEDGIDHWQEGHSPLTLKRNNGKISVTHTDQYLHYKSYH